MTDNETRFIAEICSNHNGDKDRALELIDCAAAAGFWGVKFQMFRIDKLWHSDLLKADKYKFVNERRAWELPPEWIPDLASHAAGQGLKFGVTPFYLEAVDMLEPHVDFFKIASYECLWWALYDKITETGTPLIVSLGMADANEIDEVKSRLTFTYNYADKAVLLHCVSKYPTLLPECNLAMIGRIRGDYDKMPVGWSDHTGLKEVIARAVHFWGANVIELHLDLDDCKGWEYGRHCWSVSRAASVIMATSLAMDADGTSDPAQVDLGERHKRRGSDGLRPMAEYRATL